MRSQRLTMSVEEASAALGISRSLAYELVRRGEIPSLRLGRRIVVPVLALDDLLEVGPSRRSVTSGADELGR
jgi:excisionase family DNA binding protein